jgi:hypothetical protein
MCTVDLNNQERSPWVIVLNQLVNKSLYVYCIKSPRELSVGFVPKYYVTNWSIMLEHCMQTQVTMYVLRVGIRAVFLSTAMCVLITPRILDT